jgi:hypothetical protein
MAPLPMCVVPPAYHRSGWQNLFKLLCANRLMKERPLLMFHVKRLSFAAQGQDLMFHVKQYLPKRLMNSKLNAG